MVETVPFIPENAPFTAEQRAWLNGLLAGLFSTSALPVAALAKPSHRIAVLYASQSGTAEGLARKLAKELKAQGHVPAVSTLVGYTPAALAAEKYALILASTYGDGDAPDGVQPFYEQLCSEHFPRFEGLSYAVLALGDKHYEHFCKFGKDLDAKLIALGANPLSERVDCDVDVDEPFERWKSAVIPRLNEVAAGHKTTRPAVGPADGNGETMPAGEGRSASAAKAAPAASFSRDNPLLAPLVDKRDLTHNESTKSTLHLAFSIEGTGLRYEVGDACGVIPRNDLNLVAEILQTLRFNGNEQVPCGKTGKTTLHDALTHHLQITLLNRKIVKEYATKGKCAKLLDLLVPEQQEPLKRYVYGRGLIDLLVEYPGVIEEPAGTRGDVAKAHAKALFHLIEPLGSSGSDSHNRGGGSLSIVQSRARRRLLHFFCGSLHALRPASDLHPTQQEVQIAAEFRCADHHDRPRHGHCAFSRIPA